MYYIGGRATRKDIDEHPVHACASSQIGGVGLAMDPLTGAFRKLGISYSNIIYLLRFNS